MTSNVVLPTPERPVWVRVPQAMMLTGIGRSALYELLKSGAVKTSVIAQPGATRGCRLIHVESLLQYIEAQAQTPTQG